MCKKAPPTTHNNSEMAYDRSQFCVPRIWNGGLTWCLSSSPPLMIRFSTQDDCMDVTRSALQGAHCPVDVMYLLPLTGNSEGDKELMVLEVRPNLNLLYSSMGWLPLYYTYIKCQVLLWGLINAPLVIWIGTFLKCLLYLKSVVKHLALVYYIFLLVSEMNLLEW